MAVPTAGSLVQVGLVCSPVVPAPRGTPDLQAGTQTTALQAPQATPPAIPAPYRETTFLAARGVYTDTVPTKATLLLGKLLELALSTPEIPFIRFDCTSNPNCCRIVSVNILDQYIVLQIIFSYVFSKRATAIDP